jgi:hypothetical protein
MTESHNYLQMQSKRLLSSLKTGSRLLTSYNKKKRKAIIVGINDYEDT